MPGGSGRGEQNFEMQHDMRRLEEGHDMRRLEEGHNNGSGDNCTIDKRKLIVNYIPQFTTEDDLMQVFMQIGELESIRIMRNPLTGYSYGYGFVKYNNEDDAARAIKALNGMQFKNKNLKVAYSRPPSQATKHSNLYISNLPKDFTEENLLDLFGKYGEIIQKNLLKDKNTGLPRGVAFVRFSRGDEAQAAIMDLDGKKLDNTQFPLSVRVADDHTRQRTYAVDQQVHMCNRSGCFSIRSAWNGPPQRGHVNQRNFTGNRFMGTGGGDFDYLPDMFW